MPKVTVDVEVYCASCGTTLSNQTESVTINHRNVPTFRVKVKPCKRCLDKVELKGHSWGYDEGYAEKEAEAEKAEALRPAMEE